MAKLSDKAKSAVPGNAKQRARWRRLKRRLLDLTRRVLGLKPEK